MPQKEKDSERTRHREIDRQRAGEGGLLLGALLNAATITANAATGTMETKPLTNGNNGGYDVAGECTDSTDRYFGQIENDN